MSDLTDKAMRPLMRVKRGRVWELDFLRGLAVLCMCFDHMMYDLAYLIRGVFSNYNSVNNSFINRLGELARAYWRTSASGVYGFRFWGHYIFVFIFLFLVGVSCAFSRDNVKRGCQLFVVAWAFTGATFAARAMGFMDSGVVFGILDCIALSILCVAAVDIATERIKPLNIFAPLVLGVIVCAVGIGKEFWLWGVPFDRTFDASHMFDYIIGTRGYGDDWFGLFPYVGAVLIGMYWGKAAYARRVSLLPVLDGKWNKPFCFVGRHALIFYIAHQVVIAALIVLLCLCLGYRF